MAANTETLHPFHALTRRANLTTEEKVVITAIVALSTKPPYSHLTFEGVYDRLLEEYNEHFAPRVPA